MLLISLYPYCSYATGALITPTAPLLNAYPDQTKQHNRRLFKPTYTLCSGYQKNSNTDMGIADVSISPLNAHL